MGLGSFTRKYSALQEQQAQQARDLASLQLNNLAIMLRADRKHVTGLVTAQRAHAINPADTQARLNLAVMLSQEGRHAEALELAKNHSDDYRTHQIRAFAHLAAGDIEEAIAEARLNDQLDEAGTSGRFFEGSTTLSYGVWTYGLELLRDVAHRNLPAGAPLWDGQYVEALHVIADQGIGDIINFQRYLPWVARKASRLIFSVPNAAFRLLHRYQTLLKRPVEMVESGARVEASAQVALSALPCFHGTTPDTIPADPRYLYPDPFAFPPRERGRLRVGIVWAGNPGFPRDRWRSMPFEEMLPLAADPRIDLFSLQAGGRSEDISKARAQHLVIDLSGRIFDWTHCAGAINALDVIVTVDTAVAHLAGALNKRTYLCLGELPDWRWLRERDRTPWYPETRLVRFAAEGWGGVIARVREQLSDCHT